MICLLLCGMYCGKYAPHDVNDMPIYGLPRQKVEYGNPNDRGSLP